MNELELTDLFEKYLNGELRGNELERMEMLLKQDQRVLEKFLYHKELRQKLHFYGQRKHLKTFVSKTHGELEREKQRATGKSRVPAYYLAAASISALLISISFYFGYIYSRNDKSEYSYKELSKKMKNIEAKQDAIIRSFDSDKKTSMDAQYSGTGFLVSSKGYVLTNYHLVKEADSVQIVNSVYGSIRAQVVAASKEYDLALLKIEPSEKLAHSRVPFTIRKKETEPGEEVFTMGYPREDMVYGEGSVSSSSGFEGDSLAYQISIPVNPGNSGAPLLDGDGNITGIIRGKQTEAEGTGFAVKSKYIQDFLKPFLNNREIRFQGNTIAWMNRKEKVKKIKPFVFLVKVYQ